MLFVSVSIFILAKQRCNFACPLNGHRVSDSNPSQACLIYTIGPTDILDQIWTNDLDNGKSNDFIVMW